MKIRKWFRNWLFKEDQDACEVPHTISSNRISKSHPSVETDQGFRFTVMPASGGKIVQVEHYDRRKDQHHSKLYIIGPDDKFGEEIEQIYAMEQLSR
jgi:hypothetical protein